MKLTGILVLVATATSAATSGVNNSPENHLRERTSKNGDRKLEGEVPVVEGSTDSGDEPSPDDDSFEESIFTPAMDLDFFRSIDPEYFEWVEPTEIQPGSTTCGFLHAPLGSLPDLTYPTVDVYVCVQFATNQPAPKGNMAVHCGGPGSLSDCVNNMGHPTSLGFDNADNYNVIAFDQRGMGRSTPSFFVPECDFEEEDLFPRYVGIDLTNETSILAAGEVWKKRAFRCWTYEGFRFQIEDELTGATLNYNFLEYSGTRQLAEDINRVRKLFGDQTLSIYGISYGTKVMGTFATLFPGYVNLMVLDGNDDAGSDITANARDIAESNNHRIDYILYSCSLLELESPGACPIQDLGECLEDAVALAEAVSEENSRQLYFNLLNIVESSLEDGVKLCAAIEAQDEEALVSIYTSYYNEDAVESRTFSYEFDTPSKPTSMETYNATSGSIAQDMVTAQDYSNGAYSDRLFVRTLMDLNDMYPGAGTQQPTLDALQWYGALFYWPKNTPLPPIGNSLLSGVIAGQIYDPYTPYKWTLKMRERFPFTFLLSSQSVNHGLNSAADAPGQNPEGSDPCLTNYQRYFLNGYVDFNDGQVCPAANALGTCGITAALSGSICARK